MDRDYIDRFLVVDRYITGDLSDAEVSEFEERLAWDHELIDDVELAEKLREGLHADQAVESPKPQSRSRPPSIVPLAAAASFALGLVASQVFMSPASVNGDASGYSTLVLPLEQTRNSSGQQVVVNPDSYVVLMVDVGFEHDSYRVVIRRAGESDVVWARDDMQPGYTDALAIGIPGASLSPGPYILTALPAGPNAGTVVREIPFEIRVSSPATD